MNRKTIFLSHSSKDIDKVRQIRNILETLDYEPLLFYLQCLDDDNENLEHFIKKEIEARNIFIYCKSENSDNSVWVQKELEYIRSFDLKRLFTIDISLPLNETLIQLLTSITEIIKKNRVFISCSHAMPDKEFGNTVEKLLGNNNFDVIRYRVLDRKKDLEHNEALIETNVFIPIISPNSLSSIYCKSELERVLYEYERSPADFTGKIVPIYYGISSFSVERLGLLPSSLRDSRGIEIDSGCSLSPEDENLLIQLLI